MRVVVVGGGVVGLSCAFALLEDGHEIVVLERDTPGAGASAGNAGWVTPSLSTPLAAPGILRDGLRHALDPRGALVIRPRLDPSWVRWLWRFARASRRETFERGVEALLRLTRVTFGELDRMAAAGVVFEQHAAGLLAVGRDRAALHWFEDVFDALGRLGFEGGLHRLGPGDARALEPALSDAIGAALHATVDRHVEPTTLTDGLAAHLEARGVAVRTGCDVERLVRSGGDWRVVSTDGADRRADAVVLAAAMGSTALVRPLGLRLPLLSAKGYSVTLPHTEPTPSLPLYLCEPKIGLTPFATGLRIAGFLEVGARNAAPSASRCRQLVDEARPYLVSLADAPAGEVGWAGFRPATPDSLPLLGRVPGAPGVLLATGHGMLGVTLAPATGAAVAALLRGEDDAWLAPFAPGRFG